jgi:uncharacterized membrane protein
MDSESDQDAEHLKLLSIFHYIVGSMTAMLACFPVIHLLIGLGIVSGRLGEPKHNNAFPEQLFGWAFVLAAGGAILMGWTLAACTVIAGRSIAQRKRYLFCVVVAGVMAAMCMPFGTVLGVFTIIVLMRPSVKREFGVSSGGAA